MTWLRLSGPARRTTAPLTILAAVVVALLTAVLTAVPVTARRTTDLALQRQLAAATVMERSLRVALPPDPQLPPGMARPDLGSDLEDPFTDVDTAIRLAVDDHAPGVFGPPTRVGMTGVPLPLAPAPLGQKRSAQLAVSSDALTRVRWLAGRAPVPGSQKVVVGGIRRPLVEVAISSAAAHRWRAGVGARWQALGPERGDSVPVVVTGVYEPRDPHDDLWQWYPELSGVSVTSDSQGGAVTTVALLMATPEHAQLAGSRTADITYTWIRPVVADRLKPQGLPGIAHAVIQILKPAIESYSPMEVQSALAAPVSRWRDETRALREVDASLLTGLVVLAAAVLVMLLGLRASGRAAADRLLRTRGASTAQLAVLGAADVGPAAVLGAAAGWGVAMLVSHERCPALPAVLLAAVTTAVGAAAVLPAGRAPGRDGGHGLRAVATVAGRWVPPALLVLVTALGVLTVRQHTPVRRATVPPRTLDERSVAALADVAVPVDPLVQSVPAMVALCLGVLAVALIVLAGRLGARRAARGRGAAAWLGLVQGARSARGVWLPVVALSVATTLTVLGTTVMHTADQLGDLRAWQRTGAHVRVDVLRIDDAGLAAARRLAGVEEVAAVGIRPGTLTGATRTTPVRILLADEAALRAVRAGTPLAAGAGTVGVDPGTVVVSREIPRMRDARSQLRVGTTQVPFRTVVVDPSLDDADGPPTVLVDARRQGLQHVLSAWTTPTTLLVRTADGDEDDVAGRLRQTLDSVSGTTTVPEVRREPLHRHLTVVVAVVVAAAVLLAVVAVWALAAAGATSRRQLLARARVLGLPAAGRRRLVLLQILPAGLGATLVGLGAGLALPPLLPRYVDLGAVVGGEAYPPLVPWWPAVAGASVLMIVLVLTVVALDLRATRHLSLTRHLRGGSR